jgi:hypothetical protein
MKIQQEHLPQDRPATQEETWGFPFEAFLEEQWPYLVGILLVLGIFLYARHSWRKRQQQ